ncbi:MAG: hypothetical protein H6Q33_2961 [Deltaproteobacteria bacterium]|nr:hypothetical protein [Deltaproteobacteria bacterium]
MQEGHPATPTPPSAGTLSWLRLLAALIAVSACGVAQWYIRAKSDWSTATLVLVGGSIAAAVLLGRPAARFPGAGRRTRAATGLGKWLAGTGAGLGVALGVYATSLLATRWGKAFDTAAPLVVLGWVVCTAALTGWKRAAPDPSLRLARWEIGLLIAIVALGFFLRFHRYSYFPPPDGVAAVEEPQEGQGAYHIWHDGARPWEFLGDRWLPVPFYATLGVSLTSVRIPFTLISGLTVLALYLLLRQLVARPAALLSTALFAVCHWHLMYARIAHNIFATTLLVVVVLALCVRVHRRGGLAPYPWIGFLCGYTLYTYAGYRGTTLFVGLFLGLSFVAHLWQWRHTEDAEARAAAADVVRTQASGLAWCVLAFVLTVLPLFSLLRENPAYYFEAANRSLIDRDYYTSDLRAAAAQRLSRLGATALIFNHVGDDSPTFNLPNEPMLDPVTGTLFVLALAYTIIWGRHRFQGYFAFTFLALLILGTTFVHNLDVRRLQGIIPLIFVLIAFFVDRVWQVTVMRLRRAGQMTMAVLATAVVAMSLSHSYDVYFRRRINNQNVRRTFQTYYTVANRYLQTLPDDAYLYFVSDAINFFEPNDLAWLRGERVPGTATTDLMPVFYGQPGPWAGRDLRVLIQEPYDRQDIAGLLQQRFLGTKCEASERPDDPPNLWMTACRVPEHSAPRTYQGGVQARYYHGAETAPYLERMEPAISFAFAPPNCGSFPGADEFPCRAEWEGTWNVTKPGTYVITAEVRDGQVQASIDDRPVSGAVTLASGPHVVRVSARLKRGDQNGVRLRWRLAENQQPELVPFASFEGAANLK